MTSLSTVDSACTTTSRAHSDARTRRCESHCAIAVQRARVVTRRALGKHKTKAKTLFRSRATRTHAPHRSHSLTRSFFSPDLSLCTSTARRDSHLRVRASLCARLVVVHALSTCDKLVTLLLQLAVAVASGGAGPPAAGGVPRALDAGRVRQARCACQSCLVVEAAATHPRGATGGQRQDLARHGRRHRSNGSRYTPSSGVTAVTDSRWRVHDGRQCPLVISARCLLPLLACCAGSSRCSECAASMHLDSTVENRI